MCITVGDVVSFNELNAMSELECRQMSESYGSLPDIDLVHDWYEVRNGRDGMNRIVFNKETGIQDPDYYLLNKGFYKKRDYNYMLIADALITNSDGKKCTLFDSLLSDTKYLTMSKNCDVSDYIVRRVLRDLDRNWYLDSRVYYVYKGYEKTVMDTVQSYAESIKPSTEILFDPKNWCDTGNPNYVSEPERTLVDILKSNGRQDCIDNYNSNLVFNINIIDAFERHEYIEGVTDKNNKTYKKLMLQGYDITSYLTMKNARIGSAVAFLTNVQFSDGMDLLTLLMRYGLIVADYTEDNKANLARSVFVCSTSCDNIDISNTDLFITKGGIKPLQRFLSIMRDNIVRWGVRRIEYCR